MQLLSCSMWTVIVHICVRCGHNVSATTFRSGLAGRITIHPQKVLSVFAPVLSCVTENTF